MTYTEFGIDVASFNTITDWTAVHAAGNSWAWAKATQGSGYVNPLFESQMASGQAAGLAMGAYHFPDPRVSVATNVARFVAVASARGAFEHGAMLPMLDMENSPADGIIWSPGGANSFIPAFRDALRAATGQPKLCVYGPENWFATGFLQPSAWADSDIVLCAAQYSGIPGQLGWNHPQLAVHQYTDSAPTPGATKPTDRSVLVNGYTLRRLTIGTNEQDDDMAGFWFIGNTDTGEVALLYPNGDFVGVDGSNFSAVIAANRVPKLDVPQAVWNDMAGRLAGNLKQLAADLAAAFPAGSGTQTVKVELGAQSGTYSLTPNPA